MKKFLVEFALIAASRWPACCAIWPPQEKLKLGIDLSGGTILVYEVDTDEPAARLQHGRADLGAEEARRSRRASTRSRSARSAATGSRSSCPQAERRGGRRGQEDADRRRCARVPHPGQPQARRRRHRRAPWARAAWPSRRRGTSGPGSARSRPGPIPRSPTRHDHRPAADLEEGPLRRHRTSS